MNKEDRVDNMVLVAEDSRLISQVILIALKGYAQFEQVWDGSDVIEAYKKHQPDILYLDINLPNINGLDLLPQIIEIDKDAYVVVITAEDAPEFKEKAYERGAKDFLTKPFQRELLQGSFRNCPTLKPLCLSLN